MPYLEKRNQQQKDLAIKAQAWYLANLLIAPGISFVILLRLFLQCRNDDQQLLGVDHVRHTFYMSIIGGVSVISGCLLLFVFGGNSGESWMGIIIYFTIMHSSFVLWGVLGLAWAMAEQTVRFPRF